MPTIVLANIFVTIWEKINDFIGRFDLDGKIINLYYEHIATIPELFKWLLMIFLAIVIVLGILAFIKKTFKLFIVLAVIIAVILFLT